MLVPALWAPASFFSFISSFLRFGIQFGLAVLFSVGVGIGGGMVPSDGGWRSPTVVIRGVGRIGHLTTGAEGIEWYGLKPRFVWSKRPLAAPCPTFLASS